MDFLTELFEGCKRFSDLEYDVWKSYFNSNALKSEKEKIFESLNPLCRGNLTPELIKGKIGPIVAYLDGGRWVDELIVFSLKKSQSLNKIKKTVIQSIWRDLQVDDASSSTPIKAS